jgi:hypothetical protein
VRQDNLGFRIADMLHRCESGGRGLKRCAVGQTNIFRGMYEDAAGNEAGIV